MAMTNGVAGVVGEFARMLRRRVPAAASADGGGFVEGIRHSKWRPFCFLIRVSVAGEQRVRCGRHRDGVIPRREQKRQSARVLVLLVVILVY